MTDHSGRNRRRWALLAALATAVAVPGAALAAGGGASPRTVVARAPDGPPSFDIRETRAGRSLAAGRPASRRRAQRRMRRSLGTGAVLEIDQLTSTPRVVANASGSLTEHGRGRQSEIALGFVRRHAAAFGLDAADLHGLRVAQSYTTRGGLRIIRWHQTYRGIPAFDTGLRAALRGNRLVSIAGPPQPHLSVPSVRPRISKAAAMRVGVPHTARRRGYGGLTLFP